MPPCGAFSLGMHIPSATAGNHPWPSFDRTWRPAPASIELPWPRLARMRSARYSLDVARDTMSAAMDLGMVGLGVMGRNFLLNLADHGYGVAGLDKDPAKVTA